MDEDFDEKKQRAYINRRAIMDLGMGLIYSGMYNSSIIAAIINWSRNNGEGCTQYSYGYWGEEFFHSGTVFL